MTPQDAAFQNLLGQLEAALTQTRSSLLSRDPEQLRAGAESVRQAVLLLSDLQSRVGQITLSAALQKRLQAAAAQLAALREQLLRASVQVDRAVQALLPEAGAGATYEKSLGRGASALSKAYKG